MKKKVLKTLGVLVLLGGLAFTGVHSVSAEEAFDVQKAISAGDHQGLADYYKAQAEAYRAKAAKHETMEADYRKSKAHYKGQENTMAAHCAILKSDALRTASEYDDLARKEEVLIKKK